MGFEPLGSVASLQPRWDSPLDTLIVSHIGRFVKSYIITEKILDENLGVFAALRFSFLLAFIIPLKAWVVKRFSKLFLFFYFGIG